MALTANAMMAQLERCRDADMDDYPTKPLDIARLQHVLDRFLSEETVSSKAAASSDAPQENEVAVALSRLSEITDGDAEFAAEIVDAFIGSGEEALQGMRAGIAGADATAMKHSAHKLKGAAANLHLNTLAELASRIETHSGDPRDCDQVVHDLGAQFRRAVDLLRSSIATLAAPARATGRG